MLAFNNGRKWAMFRPFQGCKFCILQSQEIRSITRSFDRAERGRKKAGGLGACKPPNGVQGAAPQKFFETLSPPRCAEIAIPGEFLIRILINQNILGFLNPRKSQKIFWNPRNSGFLTPLIFRQNSCCWQFWPSFHWSIESSWKTLIFSCELC